MNTILKNLITAGVIITMTSFINNLNADQPLSADLPCHNKKLAPEKRAENVLSLMTTDEKKHLVVGYNSFFIYPLKRFGLREVYMTDATAGVHIRRKLDQPLRESISYPSASALAATWDRNLAEEYGNSVGRECRQLGSDFILGPGFNLYRVSACGRNFEYMGEDPLLTANIATSYVKGVQEENVIATAKHFICNNHEWLRHTSNSIVDERTLHEIYMFPWYFVINRGKVGAVMSSYNLLNGEQVSQSRTVLAGYLNSDIGFEGLIMSDWGAVKSSKTALKSGLDLIMPRSPDKLGSGFKTDEKMIPYLDKMCKKILTTLFRFGIYDRERKDPDYLSAAGIKKCEQVALDTARSGITLLKNNGILPITVSKDKSILVTGPGAMKTMWSGKGSGWVAGYDHTNIGPEFQNIIGAEHVTIDENWKKISDESLAGADIVILCMDIINREGADQIPELSRNQEALVNRAVAKNRNTVVVVASGSGIRMDWADSAAAVLWTYYPGQYGGQAVAEIITGKVNPSGKLPYTIERRFSEACAADYRPEGTSLSQYNRKCNAADKLLPEYPEVVYKEGVFLGYRWYDKHRKPVRFPFGHGLSYTTFKYDNLKIKLSPNLITVKAEITNTGKIAGDETVQLYIGAKTPNVPRPERELKDFMKIHLEPGKTEVVEFKLSPVSLAYYDIKDKNWLTEAGEYVISLAASSRDIRKTEAFKWDRELRFKRPSDIVPEN